MSVRTRVIREAATTANTVVSEQYFYSWLDEVIEAANHAGWKAGWEMRERTDKPEVKQPRRIDWDGIVDLVNEIATEPRCADDHLYPGDITRSRVIQRQSQLDRIQSLLRGLANDTEVPQSRLLKLVADVASERLGNKPSFEDDYNGWRLRGQDGQLLNIITLIRLYREGKLNV